MIPTRITNHVERGKGLLIEQFKNKPVIAAFLTAYLRPFQELEDVFWDIIETHILDNAIGDQLDHIGRVAGEARLGRGDDEFRAAVRIRIRVNRSKGRSVDILDVAILAAPDHTPRMTEYSFLSFEVETYGEPGEQYVAGLLNKTRAATSYGIFTASDLEFDDVLHFDDAVSPIAGLETFSDAESGTGLVAASAYRLG